MSERYALISSEKASFPITRGCKLLGVSTSGYYAWRERPCSPAARRRAEIARSAARVHAAAEGVFGYRRVHHALVEQGEQVSTHLVRRVLREQDLHGVQPRAYRVTTKQDPEAKPAPDLLLRDFRSATPGTKLVGDITYIRTWAGWAYLAVVIDLATRMVVGWSVANRATASLCVDALEMAQRNGLVLPDAIFHSDRGTQYTSDEYRRCLSKLKLRQSMGRTGVCWDNAMAETFFASLKVESVYRTALPSLAHARRLVSRYIEVFYNRQRYHSALDYQTPHQRYCQLTNQAKAA